MDLLKKRKNFKHKICDRIQGIEVKGNIFFKSIRKVHDYFKNYTY